MSQSYPVRQLAELCAAHPLESKILFVPDMRAGYDLTTALARTKGWANLRVTTPILLAAEQQEPGMAARGLRRLHRAGGRRLVDALLTAWPSSERRYFQHIVNTGAAAGLAESIHATFDALRLAKVLPEHLRQWSTGDKGSDLATLFERYVAALAQNSLWDDAALLTAALDDSSEHAPGEIVWAILDETELPQLTTDFVQQQTGNQLWRLGRHSYGVPPPPQSAASRFRGAKIPGGAAAPPVSVTPRRSAPRPKPKSRRPPTDVIQGDLFLDPLRAGDPQQPPPELYSFGDTPTSPPESVEVSPGGRLLTGGLTPEDADAVRLQQVIGLETEVRFVLRDVLAAGLAFDDVEIAYTTQTPYQSLLYDAVERWDLPADFAGGIPTSRTRPGRGLTAFLGWIAQGLDGTTLAGLLRSGEICWSDTEVSDTKVTDTEATPGMVARGLLQGRAAQGKGQILAALDRLDTNSTSHNLGWVAAAHRHLGTLFECIPDGDGADDLVAGVVTFLQRQDLSGTTERDMRDRDVRGRLVTDLQSLCGLPAASVSRSAQAQRLLDLVQRHTSEASPAQPGSLRLAGLPDAGYAGRRHLYILGLDESHFPGLMGQDPILLDEERRAISPSLQLETHRAGSAAFQLIRLLGTAPGRVTLVASRLHLADGREPYPTPLFEQASRQLQREPAWSGPVPEVNDGVVDDLEALLAHRTDPAVVAALARLYPDTASGLRVMGARAQAAPTRFSGWIAQQDVEALDLSGTRTLSSRMLETLAVCPRRYLLRDVLGVVPPRMPEYDPRRWLHPLEMGNLLHGLFLDFMREIRQRGERPGAGHETRRQELVKAAIAAERQRVPVTLEAGYRNDCRRIERASRIFLAAEAQRLAADPALEPAGFELEFGFGDGAPVEVRLSHEVSFRLRGRIDRVDGVRDASGKTTAYEIWDYKTGSTFNYDAANLAQGGRTLQWALYAYALPYIVQDEGHVRLSGYFFASDRGAGQRFSDAPPARHELAAVLKPLFDLARQGFFPALHKGDAKGGGPCRFCDYRRICANEARGVDEIEDLYTAATQLSALVEGWAETVTTQRSGSRQSLESAFADLGLVPTDVAPQEVVRSVRDWIDA